MKTQDEYDRDQLREYRRQMHRERFWEIVNEIPEFLFPALIPALILGLAALMYICPSQDPTSSGQSDYTQQVYQHEN